MSNIVRLSSVLLVSFLAMFEQRADAQQLPQFSQYIFNQLYINPAYAGYRQEGYVQATYRKQWGNFPGAPETFSFSADFGAYNGKMGFGLLLLGDEIGPTKTVGGLLNYAYHIRLGPESYLGLGVSGGAYQFHIDTGLLQPNEENDELIQRGDFNLLTSDLNAGLFFHKTNFYAGLSAFNLVGKNLLSRRVVELAYLDIHFNFTMGGMVYLGEKVQLKPSILVKEVRGAPTSYDINVMALLYERVWLGGSYRSNVKWWKSNLDHNLYSRNAFAIVAEIYVMDNLRMGYSYDYNLNAIRDFRSNSHEFSIGYYLSPRDRVENRRKF